MSESEIKGTLDCDVYFYCCVETCEFLYIKRDVG